MKHPVLLSPVKEFKKYNPGTLKSGSVVCIATQNNHYSEADQTFEVLKFALLKFFYLCYILNSQSFEKMRFNGNVEQLY